MLTACRDAHIALRRYKDEARLEGKWHCSERWKAVAKGPAVDWSGRIAEGLSMGQGLVSGQGEGPSVTAGAIHDSCYSGPGDAVE